MRGPETRHRKISDAAKPAPWPPEASPLVPPPARLIVSHRQLKLGVPSPTPFTGSPSTVADQIQRWFQERALDGLNYHVGHPAQWRRFRSEVVPILQERGIVRSEYSSDTLRGNLGLPVPENRHTRARRERAAAPARASGPAPATA